MNDLKLSPKERELIETIMNVQNSKHNPSKTLKRYAKECFDKLLNS